MIFETPKETLYIVLTIAVALLTIFISVTLIYLTLVLRDAGKILEKVRDTTEKVNAFVIKPVKLASTIVDYLRPIIEGALERSVGRRRKK